MREIAVVVGLPLNTFIGFDSSIRCSVSSFAGIHSSVFCYYLGVGRSLYLDKPPDFIRLAVGLSTPLTARSTIGAP